MSVEDELVEQALPGYEVGREIGRGGWGVVRQGEHRTLRRAVAVKQLPRAFGADPEVRQRFLAEARVVASLEHPHIVPVYDFVERDGVCLIVMELLTGGTLWERVEAGPVPVGDACAIALAVLAALDHAHSRGVLHRDIKPDNVLFNDAGVPKLVDFGIAKVLGEASEHRTATGVIMGTPAYMAPEQGTGRPVGPATDVYAIGVVLYELLGGRLPFESTGDSMSQLYRHVNEPPPPLAEVAPSVPRPIADVVMVALAKDAADRHPGAAAFATALAAAAAEALGPGWLADSDVPVMGVARLAPSATPPERPSTPTVIVAPPPPGPTPAPGPAPAPAVTVPPAAAGPPSAAPAAGSAIAPGPTGPPSAPSTRSRIPLLVGGAVAAVAAVVALVLVLGGGDDDTAQVEADPTEVPQSAISRFRTACRDDGVSDELCTCALDASLAELTVAEFMANDELLRTGAGTLTDAVAARFDRCLG